MKRRELIKLSIDYDLATNFPISRLNSFSNFVQDIGIFV